MNVKPWEVRPAGEGFEIFHPNGMSVGIYMTAERATWGLSLAMAVNQELRSALRHIAEGSMTASQAQEYAAKVLGI
jgi:hypothetical protein